ncbi:MAG: DUF4097 family beta strand repeat-containing protein [Planctomycetota bacterium]
MKNSHFARVSLVFSLSLAAILAGCCINIGCAMRARYETTVQLSAPLSAGSTFAAQTHNGSITIEGADVSDCSVTATIVGQAGTEEEAQEIAEKTKVTLEPSGNTLTAKIEKPTLRMNQSVSVSLDITVPNKTNLKLTTHNGAVEITNITGTIDAITHNGKVTATAVDGSATLETHNGSITSREISGDAQLKTHNGSVKAFYSEAAQSVCNISIVTYNGSIEFAAPPDFSGHVRASTSNGSVHTDLPITISGKMSKSEITGTIGTGEGKLHLETHNGSIRIK